MTTDRLALYNIAILRIGESEIDSLTEDRDARRKLDNVWTRGRGAVWYFLEQGFWNFAMRAVKQDASSSITPSFGFTQAFELPSDMVQLNMLSSGDTFNYPLTQFEIEAGILYANVDPIYMSYVSDDANYGGDFSRWPESFTLWAGHWLATQIAAGIMNDVDYKELKDDTRRLLNEAKAKDGLQSPPRFTPLSSWATSRYGRQGRRDRGLRTTLTGS